MSSCRKRIIFLILSLLCVFPLSRTVQAIDITTIVGGLNGAYGSDYVISLNQAFFVERYAGNIHRINMADHSHSVIGTGYNEPTDIAITADKAHAYVVENGGSGTLLLVNLASANRAAATVVSTNIAGIGGQILGQLALDEAHGYAYVIQNSGFGVLWRINLVGGAKTKVLSNFETNPWGLLLTKDLTFAYYTELGLSGKVKRINLNTNTRETLATGLNNPSYLCWADSSESAILVAESGAGRVSSINLTTTPASVQQIVTGLPNINTESVRRISEDSLLVCMDPSVVEVNLSPFTASGPILLGIGHVPFDRIFAGYADTTGDPGYFFQVKDAPFGGTLSLMINHEGAYNPPLKARYYKVLVDGVEQKQSWSDYRWNGSQFVLETMNPDSTGYYTVRIPGVIWYNHWLGYRLDTSGLTNGMHTITVSLYKKNKGFINSYSLNVMIDNRWPTARIDKIYHDGHDVSTCAIVDGSDGSFSDTFTFCITAYDNEGHLLSWRLDALWGDNKSKFIASGSYTPASPPIWYGTACPPDPEVPSPAWDACVIGDPTSVQCAHTFYLSVWDRTIDGYNHIHWSGFHKSITIMLPWSCGIR